jgi:hypothetical protein
MAAGALPKPGTKYGPCKDACGHRDCAAIRENVAAVCSFCDKPIGYDTRFYQGEPGQSKWVHADCLERAIEAERAAST